MEHKPSNKAAMCCAHCRKPIETHTSLRGASKPKEGSLSLCFYCGTLSVFTDSGALRSITDEEVKVLKESDPVAWTMVVEAQKLIAEKILKS